MKFLNGGFGAGTNIMPWIDAVAVQIKGRSVASVSEKKQGAGSIAQSITNISKAAARITFALILRGKPL